METIFVYSYELRYTGPHDNWGYYHRVRKEIPLDEFLHRHPVHRLKNEVVYELHPHRWPKNRHIIKVTDLDGKILCLSRLIELRLNWEEEWREKNPWRHRNDAGGIHKPAWRWFRSIRTTQERRWAHAWDCEEHAPHVRSARQGRNLPNAWDDYWAHNEKCWKYQSKRKSQWRPK